jgi:hypothetical protein
VAAQPVDRLEILSGRLRGQFKDFVGKLIDEADLGAQIDVDQDTAAATVRSYAWLLDAVGSAGIPLTKAGYLPPAVVRAAASELRLEDEWIGKLNREDYTPQVYEFRQTARSLGLLRVHRGRLLSTRLGASLHDDPIGLWTHLAGRLPLASHEAGYDAGVLLLLIAAAQAGPNAADPTDVDIKIALGLHACGWGFGPTVRPADKHEVDQLTWETGTVLRRLRAHDAASAFRGRERSEAEKGRGAAFARAALLTWA